MAKEENHLLFTKENYMLVGIGVAAMILGYLLMAGGASDDPDVYNPEIFNFRRVYLAPIIITIGLGIVMYAIFKKPKEEQE